MNHTQSHFSTFLFSALTALTLTTTLHATPLHDAAKKGDVKKIRALFDGDLLSWLKSAADPCGKDEAGCTPLHYAAAKGYLRAVKILLRAEIWGVV